MYRFLSLNEYILYIFLLFPPTPNSLAEVLPQVGVVYAIV